MVKTILVALLSLLLLLSNVSGQMLTGLKSNNSGQGVAAPNQNGPESTGTFQKMIVASGTVSLNLDLNRINGTGLGTSESIPTELRFEVEHDSFFTVLVFNDQLRGPVPSAMGLIPQNSANVPAKLNVSMSQLVIEKTGWGEHYDLVVRDGKTGFVFFNIEGNSYDYDANQHVLSVATGRLLLSDQFALELGRPAEAGSIVGQISISANLRPIEITKVVNDEVVSDVLPGRPAAGTTPGPDVIVGDLNGLSQPDAGVGTQVGISVGTDSCNLGNVDLDWFAAPVNDHPVIPQNLYRMSGGASNNDRFEQIGQSSVKHAFTALTDNICNLGCNGVGGTHLGSGCSDPYVVSLNSGGSAHTLGSRAWINPFTGAYPRDDSATPPNNHSGHTHNGVSHRMVVEVADLNTTLNPGATYFAEAMYVTPHEYVWCQAHAGQCNQYNNVSYRQYGVTGTTGSFTFQTGGFVTQRAKAAISAWTGATSNQIEPAPGVDGIGTVAYKVTNPSAGVWHYEYAVYNQNMDRAIQSFSVPAGAGVTVSNIGFHMPPQQPAWTNDGTVGSTGFSSTPWTQSQAGGAVSWNSETFAQNPNANAIRWGTMYNFRFDSNRPPQAMLATVGFLKTGSPITVAIMGPSPASTNLSVSGRITNTAGQGVYGSRVTITDSSNVTRTILSGSYGYYSFDGLTAGATYTISVASKLYTFTPQVMQVNDNLTGVNFVSTGP